MRTEIPSNIERQPLSQIAVLAYAPASTISSRRGHLEVSILRIWDSPSFLAEIMLSATVRNSPAWRLIEHTAASAAFCFPRVKDALVRMNFIASFIALQPSCVVYSHPWKRLQYPRVLRLNSSATRPEVMSPKLRKRDANRVRVEQKQVRFWEALMNVIALQVQESSSSVRGHVLPARLIVTDRIKEINDVMIWSRFGAAFDNSQSLSTHSVIICQFSGHRFWFFVSHSMGPSSSM